MISMHAHIYIDCRFYLFIYFYRFFCKASLMLSSLHSFLYSAWFYFDIKFNWAVQYSWIVCAKQEPKYKIFLQKKTTKTGLQNSK